MTTPRKKILAISGSIRNNSANESILKMIGKRYAETLDVQLYAGIAELPYFHPDMAYENVPVVVTTFRNLIEQADGVLICTPEYVFSLPGALKNALEWTVATTIFSDKPVALIVASAAGEKAFESLLLIMKTLGAKIGEYSSLLIKGARGKFNSNGEIGDETILKELEKLITSFQESMNGRNIPVDSDLK